MLPYFTIPPLALGGLTVYPFAVCLLLGWVASGVVGAALAVQRGRPVAPAAAFFAMPLVGIPFGHVLQVLAFHPEDLTNPAALLAVTTGFLGIGVVASTLGMGALVASIFARDRFWPTLDAVVGGQLALWWFYRLGCTIVHDHPGTVSRFPLAVQGICESGGFRKTYAYPGDACHDLGMYEWLAAGACIAAVAVLRLRKAPDGLFLAVPLLGYPVTRWALYALDPMIPGTGYLVGEGAVLALGMAVAVALIRVRTRAASAPPTPR